MDDQPVPSHPFPLWRRALATAGAASAAVVLGWDAFAMWVDPWWVLAVWLAVPALLLAASTVLLHVPRVELAIPCRAVWWWTLVVGGWTNSAPWANPWKWMLVAGPAIALLASGRFGLEPGTGAFRPAVLTRSLIVMMLTALTMAGITAFSCFLLWATEWLPGNTAVVGDPGVVPLLLVASVVGLSRTRAWGLFAYAAAILVSIGMSIAASEDAALYHAFCAVVLFVLGAPVLSALIFKRRPSQGGRRWGQYVHAALVCSVVGLVLYFATST